ncbi:AraC-like DNA-binding protein [Paraburkholderia bannensis]|uniref:AraC-like DNA-binding protein n=1 Tax=Paraburkholderia bannensis TaxID=765414 RepID=A0A7W9WTF9_9BURK|nr:MULTISPECIES: helix-turn-helix domain-containing protein [Paraburkholderia]MBB3258258.1 AraC-like DNA-binding protein [Paraburkholderia sp. WP4_3_2]MBB6103271.1 AraC-like DNA-binding protein [Paraburkholderia bannensis]
MNSRVPSLDVLARPARDIVHSRFSVAGEAPQRRLLAWRDRVGHMVDVLPSRADLERPFQAAIDRFQVGDLVMTDCRSDAMLLDRSLARISTDRVRDFVFQVFMEGSADNVRVRATSPAARDGSEARARILALDMNQPFRMQRQACRLISFFVPATLVQEVFPDPEAIHGRTLDGSLPLEQLILDHVATLGQTIGSMNALEADEAIRAAGRLTVAAFGRQARLSGDARAAARAAMFGQIRRYIQAHLTDDELSPESVLAAFEFPRPTLYRLFQHEGGVNAYIRQQRLRRAADDLIRHPHLAVVEIAYGLGFKSASDFTRAFRRAFDMAPLDYRALVGRRMAA